MQSLREFHRQHLQTDLAAGLVVFLIALPLCLGISLASGAPLFSGIIAGIVGGLVVGAMSGAAINVSGPAASVALVIFTGIQDLGSFQIVLVSVMLAGVVQIALGYLRAGNVASFFPNTMIKGILASIGLMLIIKQLPHAFGVQEAFETTVSFGESPASAWAAVLHIFDQVGWGAVVITVAAMALIVVWDRPALKRLAFFRAVPSALAAVLLGVVLNLLFGAVAPALALTPGQLVTLPEADSLAAFVGFFSLPDFAGAFAPAAIPKVITVALSIAFIASLETLLSTEAGDKLDPYKRRTSTNRELKAQGVGNIVAGLIGGLPITAVIVRTSANVGAGARTKVATMTHGLLMLLCVALVPGLLNKIPLAALSAVLFVVGYKLTSVSVYTSIWRQGRRQFLPFILTVLAVMATDLITGIIVGGAVAVFFVLRDNYKNPYLHDRVLHEGQDRTVMVLSEETSFLNKADITRFLDGIPENHNLVINGERARSIHPDVIEIIEDFQVAAERKNIALELVGLDLSKASISAPSA